LRAVPVGELEQLRPRAVNYPTSLRDETVTSARDVPRQLRLNDRQASIIDNHAAYDDTAATATKRYSSPRQFPAAAYGGSFDVAAVITANGSVPKKL